MSLHNVQHEWKRVGETLADYTYMFHKVWSMGMPTFTDTLPTAAVGFDKRGNHISFMFNPKFWNKLNQYQRAFVTAHESLHVILDHGIRSVNARIPRLSNIAMDVVVNHMLIDYYGFDRTKLGFLGKDMCWLDTVFPKDKFPVVLWGQNYEYYYTLLEEKAEFIDVALDSFDDHSHLPGVPFDKMGNMPADIAKDVEDAKGQDGKDASANPATGRGTGEGNTTDQLRVFADKKHTWREIFQHLAKVKAKAPDINEQWARLHRRLQALDPRLMIPSEYHSEEAEAPEKIAINLYLDVSGSCWSYREYFAKAYESIPKDLFEIKLFQFDMRVRPVTVEKDGTLKFVGGGGTSFANIESYIRQNEKEYPEIVVVFTDGDGGDVTPKHPERWFWFLGQGCESHTYCIPKKSYVFSLGKVTA